MRLSVPISLYFPWRSLAAGLIALVFAGAPIACTDYSEWRESLSPADQARFDRGRSAATPCWSCHDVMGSGQKMGPPLGGLYGRKVGSVAGYPYSSAMLSSHVVWNEQSLNSFLASPQRLIPGNRMISAPIADAVYRADLVFFLSRVTRPRPARLGPEASD